MRIYCTFGGASHDYLTEKIVRDGPRFGADKVLVFDDKWLIESGFVERHTALFKAYPQHGFGFCSWKPFVILAAIQRSEPGDVILYTDADTYPISSLVPLFEFAERDGVALFEEQGCINNVWTKRDCFIAMGCDEPKYHNGLHACGRFQLFKKDGLFPSRNFLEDWLHFATDPRCSLHDAGVAPNLPEFRRNSTEQSVLSLLAIKFGVHLHRTPDENGWPITPGRGREEDTYPMVFKQEWCTGDRGNLNGSQYRNV